MRFTDDGVHFTDADLAVLRAQHAAELAALMKLLVRALEAAPDERERMRREHSAYWIAAQAANQPPAPPPTSPTDPTIAITQTQLAEMIKHELHRNNARWEQIANRILYADQPTLIRLRAAHERERASRSVPPAARDNPAAPGQQ
jgi:hypothetical protein